VKKISMPVKSGIVVSLLVLLCGCASGLPVKHPATLTQVSTYQALDMGLYDGEVTYERLAGYGDFGIGTFTGIDGEMIALDGIFYQALADGTVRKADPGVKAPFAMVHFFRGDRRLRLAERIADMDALKRYLARHLPTANRPYAFRIAGTFSYLKIRSVPGQSKPYPPLRDVVARQAIFEFTDLQGTIVGYWLPEFLSGINMPGFHLHFISRDGKHAGHILSCSVSDAEVGIDDLEGVALIIPQNRAFQDADFVGRKN
jgi:acetolactate decarboxylase